MKKVAILIDGSFLLKSYRDFTGKNIKESKIITLSEDLIEKKSEEIFRIFYYDAPPFEKKLKNPIDKVETDYAKTPTHIAITKFQDNLAKTDLIAFRKGKLSFADWKIGKSAYEKIRAGGKVGSVNASDFIPDFKQKGVDIKIGLDIAWLSTKRIVDKIILVTADNDFVPAMKFARKEGVHVAVAKIGKLTSEMYKHSDYIIEVDLKKY